MKAYLDLKTRTKLTLSFVLVSLLFAVLLALSYGTLVQVQTSQQRISETYLEELLTIEKVLVEINTSRAQLLAMTLGETPESLAEASAALAERAAQTEARLEQALQHRWTVEELDRLWQTFETNWRELNRVRTTTILPLIEQERFAEARALAMDDQARTLRELRATGERIAELTNASLQSSLAGSQRLIDRHGFVLLVVALIVALLIIFMVWGMNRAIASPLIQLTQWANRLAQGDLGFEQNLSRREDEVGLLTQAFERLGGYLNNLSVKAEAIASGDLNIRVDPESDRDVLGTAFARMAAYLGDLAARAEQIAKGDLSHSIEPQSERDVLGSAFFRMVTTLRRLISELQEGVSVLATSSQEILASTSQVVSSAQETAAAISEITTTVEEVKQTVTVSSEKARHVNEAALRTVKVSQEGRKAVGSALEGMVHIREQMQAVAESIIRLSEQSQAIGDIVSTVNDLAEQSNMLGVNASIEAAKAGEQGKGFSVVAQEVKVLADQSKQATAQVRSILVDLQKAMNKAVLVAEEGGKVVDKGYHQAELSGETIRSLSESIEESSGAAVQIASSSQQQMVGMDQIALAMENIKQASQDNVAGTRQSEAAARNINELGQALKSQAAQFRL